MDISQKTFNVNFTIMKDTNNETYLGDVIGNNVTKDQTFNKPLQGMEKLSTMWLKEHVEMSGQMIVANTLLTAKIAHQASVNGISKDMKTKIS